MKERINNLKFIKKQIKFNENNYDIALLNDEPFVIEFISRLSNIGTAPKFWLSKIVNNKLEKKYMVKHPHDCSQYEYLYEALYSKVGKKINFPIMTSEIITSNNKNVALLTNYIKENEIELNFEELANKYNSNKFEKEYLNYVDGILKIISHTLDEIYSKDSFSTEKRKFLKESKKFLQKTVIIDYLLGGADRDLVNNALLMKDTKSEFNVRFAPLFDNGYTKTTQNYSNLMLTLPKKELNNRQFIISRANTKANEDPLLSISKPISNKFLSFSGDNFMYKRLDANKDLTFVDDLAHEIVKYPYLYNFYKNFTQKVNINKLLDNLNSPQLNIHAGFIELSKEFHKIRHKTLEKAINKVMEENMGKSKKN